MSYILDALRKSDQLRRRGAAPTLPADQAAVTAPKQPALALYGLLAFVLLGAGIAIGWLRPWQATLETRPPAAATVTAPEPAQSPALRPAIAARPQPGELGSAPAVPTVPVPAPAAAPVQTRAGAGVERPEPGASPKPVAALPPRAAAPAGQSGSVAGAAAGTASATAVMTVAELPAAIQQELPPLSTSVHAYSGRPAERLVGINNRLLHEGEYVAPGLRLEQITPEGMVLSYKGYTFRRGVH